MILPTPQLDQERNDSISGKMKKTKDEQKKKPSCVERLLLTAAGYVDFIRQFSSCTHTYIVVEAERCRVFPHLWQAGRRQKQTSTAGRVAAAAAAAFTLPKMPFSSQQHSLVSSCRLPPPKSNSSSKAEGVAAIETNSTSSSSSLQSSL